MVDVHNMKYKPNSQEEPDLNYTLIRKQDIDRGAQKERTRFNNFEKLESFKGAKGWL